MTSTFFRRMYNKMIIKLGFCGIQNNQGLGKGYPSAPADNPRISTFIFLDITKTSSNIVYNLATELLKYQLGIATVSQTGKSSFRRR